MAEKGSLVLHFDGDITVEHRVTARTMGKAILHTQGAIDRAYLDIKYGNLWKYARMKGDDYEAADFIALYPSEGGWVQELLSEHGRPIIDRVSQALYPAIERLTAEGENVAESLSSQVESRKNQLAKGMLEPDPFMKIVEEPGDKVVRKYADRAINRELDQVLSIIRSPYAGESMLEVTTQGGQTLNYVFDRFKSEHFHSIVSRREVGEPVLYVARVTELDHRRLNGKFVNLENDRQVSVRFLNEADFMKVKPYLGAKEELSFIGSPIIEYGAFDPGAGDIYFLDLLG